MKSTSRSVEVKRARPFLSTVSIIFIDFFILLCFLKLIISLCFNNKFPFLSPTDDTKHTNLFSLSPDEPDEPDGWRNVLFFCQRISRISRNLFFCVLLCLLLFKENFVLFVSFVVFK